jgi:hypothetical protein
MPVSLTPSASDLVVQAPYALIKSDNALRAELDLRNKFKADLQILVAGGGNTALTTGVIVAVRRKSVTTGCGDIPAFEWSNTGRTTYGLRTINNEGGYAAEAQSFAFDGSGGVSFALRDALFFWGVDTIPTVGGLINPANGCEGLTVSAGTSTPVRTVCQAKYAKIDNEFFAQADVWAVTLEEGLYEVSWDYASQAAGEAVACMAWMRPTNSYVQTTT